MPGTQQIDESGIVPRIRFASVAGGAAGDITVTGIKVGDNLVAVLEFGVVTSNFQTLTDRTSEFTITADNTINNAGGTATTGDVLLVVYYDNPNV